MYRYAKPHKNTGDISSNPLNITAFDPGNDSTNRGNPTGSEDPPNKDKPAVLNPLQQVRRRRVCHLFQNFAERSPFEDAIHRKVCYTGVSENVRNFKGDSQILPHEDYTRAELLFCPTKQSRVSRVKQPQRTGTQHTA